MYKLKIKNRGPKPPCRKPLRLNTHVLSSELFCGLKWLVSNSRFDNFYPFLDYLKQKQATNLIEII